MLDRLRVLVIDDDPDMRAHLRAVLEDRQMDVTEAGSGGEATAVLGRPVDVVLLDVQLPDASGLDVLQAARRAEADCEFVVMTGHADIETAVEAMRLGAYHFLAKPFKNAVLVEVVTRAAEKKALRRENSALKHIVTRQSGLSQIVGESAAVRTLLSTIDRVARHDASVLIYGESGTGKELVARAVHAGSGRAARPFVSLNCAAVPDTLLGSELFGHAKGAFTGAVAARPGLFQTADGGTLFLDEIGEMSPSMQAQLLRTLDSGEVRRIGDERPFTVNVRVLGATAKDLERESSTGRFRLDLFYRLSVVVVTVPPLRDRTSDIPMLIRHFSGSQGPSVKPLRFSQAALDRLAQYAWPGNVRELRNLVERLQILREGEEVGAGDLPGELRATSVPVEVEPEALVTLDELERRYVERVLRVKQWNKAEAARILGVDVKTLNKRIREWGVIRPA